MLLDYKLGQTSVVIRVKLRDSSVSTGAGLAGLTFSSSGLKISTIADNEAAAVAYTQAGSTVETVTTLGTYAAPTATKCRFREVDATNHPGIYEVQVADARFAVAGSKSLLISFSGATNLAQTDVLIPLRTVNLYATDGGLTLAKTTNLTGLNDIAATAIVSGGAIATSSGAVSNVTTTATATNLTNAPTAGDFTATMKTSLNSSTPTANLNAAQTGWTPRDLSAVADASLTTADLLFAGYVGGVGDATIVGTTFTKKTASTAATVAVKTLDSATTPTTIS